MENLIYDIINEKYGRGRYGNFEVIIMRDNGYINISKLVSQATTSGGKPKLFSNWRDTKQSKKIIDIVSARTGLSQDKLMLEPIVKNELRGTYVHELLCRSIAGWASPEFEVDTNLIINQYFIKERELTLESLMSKKCTLEGQLNQSNQEMKSLISFLQRDPVLYKNSMKYVILHANIID